MIRWEDTYDKQVAAMSDDELLRAFRRSRTKPDDPGEAGLLAEIERRHLDAAGGSMGNK